MKQLILLVIFAFYLAPTHAVASTTIHNLVCGNDAQGISFKLEIPDFDEWSDVQNDPITWALGGAGADSSCRPTFETSPDKRVSYSGITGSTCGTLTEDATNLIYTFLIDADPSGSGLTHKYDHTYTITCTYNKEKSGLQASFLPQHQVNDSDTATGILLFEFKLFVDSTGIEVDPATTYDLRTTFTGNLTVTNSGFPSQSFDVHFKLVQAANNQPLNNPTTLLSAGCSSNTAIASDSTCQTNNEDSFTFDAFRYAGSTTGALVYMQATAIVCIEDGGSTDCKTECAACNSPARRRRSTLEGALATEFYVNAGPIRISDLQKEEKADTVVDEDEGSSVPAHYIAVGAVGGVVAVAIVIVAVVIVLRKRRYNATLAESRGAHKAATPGV